MAYKILKYANYLNYTIWHEKLKKNSYYNITLYVSP